jgi:hypothetical protein
MLNSLAHAWDMAQEAREIYDREGMFVLTRHGPALRIELEYLTFFAKGIKQLNFEEDVGTPVLGRPPGKADMAYCSANVRF